MRRIDRKSAGWNDDHDDYMLNTAADGGCVFLMSDQRCSVHAEHGPDAKPEGCRRFPLGLVATPVGGRITTDHRCPCRTMGERPDIEPAAVEPSVTDGGRLIADRHIKRIPLQAKKEIKFSEWEPIEAEYLRRKLEENGGNVTRTAAAIGIKKTNTTRPSINSHRYLLRTMGYECSPRTQST